LIDCPGYTARIAFSPDGRRLAGMFRQANSTPRFQPGEAKVWDAATGQLLLTIPAHDHAGWQLAFSPDSGRLATTGQVLTVTGDFPAAGEVKVWDAATGRLLAGFQGHAGPISVIAFSPDGRRLATGGAGNRIKLWDADTGQELLTFPSGEGDQPLMRPSALAFRPDGSAVAAAVGKAVYIWEAATDDGPP
jgi:WD40 repeat protein